MPKDKYKKQSYADLMILRGLKGAKKLEHRAAKTKVVKAVGGAVERARQKVKSKFRRKKKAPTTSSHTTTRTEALKQGLRRNLTQKEIEKLQ
jgi:hypothetical protein